LHTWRRHTSTCNIIKTTLVRLKAAIEMRAIPLSLLSSSRSLVRWLAGWLAAVMGQPLEQSSLTPQESMMSTRACPMLLVQRGQTLDVHFSPFGIT